MDTYGKPRFPYVWDEIKKLVNTKSAVKIDAKTNTGTNIADIIIDGKTVSIFAPEGSSGTLNYNDLSNKPQIKSVTLTGNKSFSQLGLYEDPDLLYITNAEIEDLFTD